MSNQSTHPALRPRIRWGAIAWGVIATAIVVETLVVAGSPSRRHEFGNWLLELNAGDIVVLVAIAIGSLLLLLGILTALRRSGNRRTASDLAAADAAAAQSAARLD